MGDVAQQGKLKVLAIAGSPRRGGNTDLLLQEVIAGAKSVGAEVQHIVLSELCIAPCSHCDRCLETGTCAVEDDMQWIHADLRDADRLALAGSVCHWRHQSLCRAGWDWENLFPVRSGSQDYESGVACAERTATATRAGAVLHG